MRLRDQVFGEFSLYGELRTTTFRNTGIINFMDTLKGERNPSETPLQYRPKRLSSTVVSFAFSPSSHRRSNRVNYCGTVMSPDDDSDRVREKRVSIKETDEELRDYRSNDSARSRGASHVAASRARAAQRN